MRITVRNYTENDLLLLQSMLASWIQSAGDCGYCHAQELLLRIYELGTPPAGERVQIWEDSATIIGMVLNLRFDNAFEVYTSPAYRGTDAERMMLQTAANDTLQLMRELKRDEASVIIDVWDCDETRKQMLTELGFAYYRIWGHLSERNLADELPESILPEGFTIRSVMRDEYAALAAVHNAAFGGNSSAEAYRDPLMRNPAYNPKHHLVVVAPRGRIAAFTQIWLDDLNQVGLFEPVGTHPDFQRQGLAKVLMLHAMHTMKALGMTTAMVGYDATNTPASRLYEGLGFHKKYTTLGYQR